MCTAAVAPNTMPTSSITLDRTSMKEDLRSTVPQRSLDNLQGSKKRSRAGPKKCVSFNESVRARRIMTLDEYTEEECSATWFQAEEFSTIRQKIILLVRKVERDGAQLGADKKYCIRGLEGLLSERSAKKQEARMRVQRAVLFEQDKQSFKGCISEEAIASSSIKESAESQLLAISTARKDQKEAEKVYRSSILTR